MSLITVFSMPHARADALVKELAAATGYGVVTDLDLPARAGEVSGLSADRVLRVFLEKASVYNRFTLEKERALIALRLSLAEALISAGPCILHGFVSLLLPARVRTEALGLVLVGGQESKMGIAQEFPGSTAEVAANHLFLRDRDCAAWMEAATGVADPWDTSLYDLVVSTEETDTGEIVARVLERLEGQSPGTLEDALGDFLLAARVETELVREGHVVGAKAEQGEVLLTIPRPVLSMDALQGEIEALVRVVPGVRSVSVCAPSSTSNADFYRKWNPEAPARVLLVDDEREFVETLSERLWMRDIGSVVVYDGKSALESIEVERPQVMVLDLRMPGMDGFEVLRRVKGEHPGIEVIVVSGHGTERDRQTCLELGAFTCFQKPVDIGLLCDAVRKANAKALQDRR